MANILCRRFSNNNNFIYFTFYRSFSSKKSKPGIRLGDKEDEFFFGPARPKQKYSPIKKGAHLLLYGNTVTSNSFFALSSKSNNSYKKVLEENLKLEKLAILESEKAESARKFYEKIRTRGSENENTNARTVPVINSKMSKNLYKHRVKGIIQNDFSKDVPEKKLINSENKKVLLNRSKMNKSLYNKRIKELISYDDHTNTNEIIENTAINKVWIDAPDKVDLPSISFFPLFRKPCLIDLSNPFHESSTSDPVEEKVNSPINIGIFSDGYKKLPSVRKILNETMPKESKIALAKWKENMIDKLGEEGFEKYSKGKLRINFLFGFMYDVIC